jgi:hypothetical protein
VIDCVKDALKDAIMQNVWKIEFASADNEPSRVKLYQRFAKALPSAGFEFTETYFANGLVNFVFINKEKKEKFEENQRNKEMRAEEFMSESSGKIKGVDGKACWKGYRYAGTSNGKDNCVKVSETTDSPPLRWRKKLDKGRTYTFRTPDRKPVEIFVQSSWQRGVSEINLFVDETSYASHAAPIMSTVLDCTKDLMRDPLMLHIWKVIFILPENELNETELLPQLTRILSITGYEFMEAYYEDNHLHFKFGNPKRKEELASKYGLVDEDWSKVNKKDKTDGMSQKAVDAYRRENPGSKLKTAVTTPPSKLKKGSKAAKRRKSFCARMSGMKKHRTSAKTKRDPNSNINKALRRWNCESIEEMRELIVLGEQMLSEMKQRLDPKCWKGKHKEGTKINGGIRVNNCVPNESVEESRISTLESFSDSKLRNFPGSNRNRPIPSERKWTDEEKRKRFDDWVKSVAERKKKEMKENFADGRPPEDKQDKPICKARKRWNC